jgi:hypothetical protein
LVINREQIEKAADIIISAFNRAEALSSFKAPHAVQYNLVESDKEEVASFLQHRASKRAAQPQHKTDALANHPSKQIEQHLNAKSDSTEAHTNQIPNIIFPTAEENKSPFNQKTSEILDKTLGLPSQEEAEDKEIPSKIIPH